MTDEPNDPIFPTGETLRNWLRTNISEEKWKGISGRELLNEFRSWGISIRTSDFYQVRRQVLGRSLYQDQIEALSDDTLVPASYIQTNHGLNLSSDFLYTFRVTLTNIETGETTEEERSLSYSQQVSPEFASNLFRSLFSDNMQNSGWSVDDIQLFRVLARPGIFDQ